MTKSKHIITPQRKWTDEERALIKLFYPCTMSATLARFFNCSISQMYNEAWRLGVTKSAWFKASDMTHKLKKGAHIGNSTRFPKGHKPHNKGVKGINYPGMVATQFKPGHLSANYKPVGTIRSVAGRLEIKMAEGPRQWRQLSRVVWQTCNGPIPKDCVISFIDGNTHNVEVTNLQILTLAENARRNNIAHKYGPEIKQIIQLKGAITRQINKRNKQNERHSSTQNAPV